MFDKFRHIIADPLCGHHGPSGVRRPQFGKLSINWKTHARSHMTKNFQGRKYLSQF